MADVRCEVRLTDVFKARVDEVLDARGQSFQTFALRALQAALAPENSTPDFAGERHVRSPAGGGPASGGHCA